MTIQGNEINWDAVLSKLNDIRSLRDRAGTQAEAEAAAAALTKMLAKYNLTMADLDVRQANKVSEIDMHFVGIGNQARWRQTLLAVIADANFCRSVAIVGVPICSVIGTARNVAIVQSLYDNLVPEIDRLAAAGWTAAVAEKRVSWFISTAEWKRGFRIGAVVGLAEAMAAAKNEAASEQQNGGALVVLLEQELDDALKRFHPKTSIFGSASVHGSAYEEGRIVGRSLTPGERLSA